MLESLTNMFDSDSFIPHGHCYLWNPQLVWLHLTSDALIGLAYYSIPIMLFYFVYKRSDTPFQWVFLMFGMFIIACGTNHFMAVWTLWHPDYWLSGGIKLVTAFVSLYTAAKLLNLIPKALALPTPAQLEAANHQLKQEMRERTLAEAALKLSDTRFSLIFENAAIGIVLTDMAGQILESNPAFQHMLGYSDQELQGMHFADFTHPQSLTVEEEIFQEMITGDRDFYQLEKLYIRKDGHLRWGHLTVSLVHDAQNNPQYSIATIENITEHKQTEVAVQLYREHLEELVQARTAELTQANEQLSWQATHDALTGLVNRREFERCLERTLNNATAFGQQYTLCYMDLDQFKIINDTCGHLAGDELLRQISHLLQSLCRKTDTLARLGGDEFGLLLYQCSLEESQRVVQILHDAVQEFRFVWQGQIFTIGISIGLVAINACSLNIQNILNAADQACYLAKNQGRNQVQIYQLDGDW